MVLFASFVSWLIYSKIIYVTHGSEIVYDSAIYNADNANVAHDGCMIFSPSIKNSLSNLTYQWSNNSNPCSRFSIIFASGKIFCTYKDSVLAVDPWSGNVIWSTPIHDPSTPVYISDSQTVAIISPSDKRIYGLYVDTGKFVSNITFPFDVQYTPYSLGIKNGLMVWNVNYSQGNYNAMLQTYNYDTGNKVSITDNQPTLITNVALTLCNDILISYGTDMDYYFTAHAYKLESNLSISKHVWSHQFLNSVEGTYFTPVCIVWPDVQQILFPIGAYRMNSVLLDAQTGGVINDNIYWPNYYITNIPPVLYYDTNSGSDIRSLAYLNTTSIVCYQLYSDKEWKLVWSHNIELRWAATLLTLNDLVFVTASDYIISYNFTTGQQVNKLSYPQNIYEYGSLYGGQDDEGYVWLIFNYLSDIDHNHSWVGYS